MGTPRRRTTDKCLIFRVWDQINPYWHIITTIFLVFVSVTYWVHDVSGYDARINANTNGININAQRIEDLGGKVEDIKQDTAVIKAKIDYIVKTLDKMADNK